MKLRGLYRNWQAGDQVIAAGGQANLFDIPGTSFLYKRFKTPPKNVQHALDLSGRLREMANLGHQVFVRDGSAPGSVHAAAFCWPVDVIESAGVPCGMVMPKAAPWFYRDNTNKLRTLEFLYLYRCAPPDARQRLLVLLRVLRAFNLLAEMSLVHGDLAPKNVVWTSQPSPAAFVLDVDGVHHAGSPYWDHVQTNEWQDPRVDAKLVPGHDTYSDWYALALLVMRVLLCSRLVLPTGARAPSPRDAPFSLLPPEVADLSARTLSEHLNPTSRPSPKDWARVLGNAYFPGMKPAVSSFVELDLAAARWRRIERRRGHLGPPYKNLTPFLSDSSA